MPSGHVAKQVLLSRGQAGVFWKGHLLRTQSGILSHPSPTNTQLVRVINEFSYKAMDHRCS